MVPNHLDHLLLALLIVVVISAASVALSRRLGLAPILGLMMAGILDRSQRLGCRAGWTVREVSGWAFVLLFLIGLEMQPAAAVGAATACSALARRKS